MQEPWMIGLGVAALLLLWILWQAIENAVVGSILGLSFGAIENWWKSRQSRKQP